MIFSHHYFKSIVLKLKTLAEFKVLNGNEKKYQNYTFKNIKDQN